MSQPALILAIAILCCYCCCGFQSVTGSLEIYGTVPDAEPSVLHLFWACGNASECAEPQIAKLCFKTTDGLQNLNASIVALRPINVTSGQSYRYIKFQLPESHTKCTRTYIPMLEYGNISRSNSPRPASSPLTSASQWMSEAKCLQPGVTAECAIRFRSRSSVCSDGADWYCEIDSDLPQGIVEFLLAERDRDAERPAAGWERLVAASAASASAAALLLCAGGLVLWAQLTGRLDPEMPHAGLAEGAWKGQQELVIIHPDTGADLLLMLMGPEQPGS